MSYFLIKKPFQLFFLANVIICFLFCFSSFSQAGNPTQYVTIHDPYTRDGAKDSYGNYGFCSNLYYLNSAGGKVINYMRMFIPPGTIDVYLLIKNYGQREAISHFHTPPTTAVPYGSAGHYADASKEFLYLHGGGYDFNEVYSNSEANDFLSIPTFGGNDLLLVPQEHEFTVPLGISNSGWYYVHVGDDGSETSGKGIRRGVHFCVEVEPTVYNNWWDNYGSNSDGSINWEKDVESVEDYRSLLASDFNKDGKTDYQDYAIFSTRYKETGENIPADLNKDKVVDLRDYSFFVSQYGKKTGGTAICGNGQLDVGEQCDVGFNGFLFGYSSDLNLCGGYRLTKYEASNSIDFYCSSDCQCIAPFSTNEYVSYPDSLVQGNLEKTDCNSITGWAYDKNSPNDSVNLDVYVRGEKIESYTTDITREDVNNEFNISGKHGFSIAIPDRYKDGKTSEFGIYATGSDGKKYRVIGQNNDNETARYFICQ